MSRLQSATAILFVSLCLILSHTRATAERNTVEQQADVWAAKHAEWHRTGTGSPAEYWQARAPQGNLVDSIASIEPWNFWSAGAGQEAWAVNAAAAVGPKAVPKKAIPLVAISTCALLGMELPDDEEFFEELMVFSTGAIRPWRNELLSRCGDCAPPTAPLPPTQDLHSITHVKLNPLGARNIAIAAERERRSVLASPVDGSVLAHMVSRIRNGGSPSNAEWAERGVAGMAALELAKMKRVDAIPTLLQQAESGPSRTDRIASLWAARQLGATSELIERVEAAL